MPTTRTTRFLRWQVRWIAVVVAVLAGFENVEAMGALEGLPSIQSHPLLYTPEEIAAGSNNAWEPIDQDGIIDGESTQPQLSPPQQHPSLLNLPSTMLDSILQRLDGNLRDLHALASTSSHWRRVVFAYAPRFDPSVRQHIAKHCRRPAAVFRYPISTSTTSSHSSRRNVAFILTIPSARNGGHFGLDCAKAAAKLCARKSQLVSVSVPVENYAASREALQELGTHCTIALRISAGDSPLQAEQQASVDTGLRAFPIVSMNEAVRELELSDLNNENLRVILEHLGQSGYQNVERLTVEPCFLSDKHREITFSPALGSLISRLKRLQSLKLDTVAFPSTHALQSLHLSKSVQSVTLEALVPPEEHVAYLLGTKLRSIRQLVLAFSNGEDRSFRPFFRGLTDPSPAAATKLSSPNESPPVTSLETLVYMELQGYPEAEPRESKFRDFFPLARMPLLNRLELYLLPQFTTEHAKSLAAGLARHPSLTSVVLHIWGGVDPYLGKIIGSALGTIPNLRLLGLSFGHGDDDTNGRGESLTSVMYGLYGHRALETFHFEHVSPRELEAVAQMLGASPSLREVVFHDVDCDPDAIMMLAQAMANPRSAQWKSISMLVSTRISKNRVLTDMLLSGLAVLSRRLREHSGGVFRGVELELNRVSSKTLQAKLQRLGVDFTVDLSQDPYTRVWI